MPALNAATSFKFSIKGVSATTWVARFEGEEAISELFQFELAITSEDKDIAFADAVGKPAQLTLETDKSEPRYVNGIVSRFRVAEEGKKLTVYHVTVVPKLWRLKHRHDSRIFQDLAVPAIIEKVLKDGGLAGADYRLSLTGSHPTREYCVQYRESDLAFISRLMEEEGIYYYFEHSDGKHVLVMGDAPSASGPIAGESTVAYKGALGAMAHGESVSRFSYGEEVRPGKVSLSDFNFKKPSLSLLSSSSAKDDTNLEVYDYPGEYDVPGDGSSLSKVRLEEWQSLKAVGDGESGCIRLTPGYLFTLSDSVRDDTNQEYLVTRLRQQGAQQQMGDIGTEGQSYTNTFQCIPSKVPYRPERRTRRPSIRGVQTAIVTGPGGEEIHTDEHGRVKVQFHWDRQGKKDDKSSCWIRVSQVWAGAGWGAMWIPRIGHEVIVDFIEGDPDRPIITGRVYHGTNVPPYALPGEKTKSTIKSDSSKGGGGFNELRFEDKKGNEEIYLQGEKDWNILIKHDKNQKIGHDETLDVGNDQTIHIGHDQTIHVDHDRQKTIDNDQLEKIGGNKTIEVMKDHTETIHQNETIQIDGNETVKINKNRTHTIIMADTESVALAQTSSIGGMWNKSVGGAMTLSVGLKKSESVGGSSTESVGAGKTVSVGGSSDETVAKDKSISVTKKMTLTVSEDLLENIKKNRKADIGESLEVHCGDVTITIKKDGTITVEGKDIKVKSGGTVKVEAKKIEMKSDGAVNVKASGDVIVKGGNVKMN